MLLLGHDSRRAQVKEVTPACATETEPCEVHQGHKSQSPVSPAPPPSSTADCPPLDICTLWLTCLGFLFFLPGCPNGSWQAHFTTGALRLQRGHQLISLPLAKRVLTQVSSSFFLTHTPQYVLYSTLLFFSFHVVPPSMNLYPISFCPKRKQK